MHLSMSGRRGVGGGRAWGWDQTFLENLPSNSLPTGKSFQSIATKFPHPGLHIAVHPKAGPKKGTIKISPNKTLQSLFINVAASPGRLRSVKCPTPGPTKTIKSPPLVLPPPRPLYIDRCITKTGSPDHESSRELERQSEAQSMLAPQSEPNVCRHKRNLKKSRLLVAQGTQRKLGVTV